MIVQETGEYFANVKIENVNGKGSNILAGTERLQLNEGTNTFKFHINGMEINHNGVNGHYKVVRLDIRGMENDFKITIGEDIYHTSFYSYEDFERPKAEIINISDHGSDADDNGLYDYLTTEIEVNVSEAGNYDVNWLLEVGDDGELGSEQSYYFEGGIQKIQYNFSGQLAHLRHLDGGYPVRITLRGVENDISFNYEYLTSSYDYSDFEKVEFTDYAIDADDNGLFDSVIIEFNLTVPETGTFRVFGSLKDNLLNRFSILDESLDLNKGENTIKFDFQDIRVCSNEGRGRFKLTEMEIEGESFEFRLYSGEIYTTQEYAYEDFESPGLEVVGEPIDYGVDLNGDGLYDHLVIEIPIKVNVAGTYLLEGEMKDETEGVETEAYLDMEDEFISLNFRGDKIYEKGENGPYELEGIRIRAVQNNFKIYLLNRYLTSAYDYEDFEHEIPPDIISPTINLTNPEDNEIIKTSSSSEEIDFKYLVSDISEIESCSLIVDGAVEETDNTITKDGENIFTKDLDRGSYSWSITCADFFGNENTSEIRDLTIKKKSSSGGYYLNSYPTTPNIDFKTILGAGNQTNKKTEEKEVIRLNHPNSEREGIIRLEPKKETSDKGIFGKVIRWLKGLFI